MTLRCLLVDDEPLARRVLERYVRDAGFLELVGQAEDALGATRLLHEAPVDLLFLDICLPGLTGLELLRTLPDPPRVILTTAHLEFAVEAYEHGVVDYLVKPIRFERFLKAVHRARAPGGAGAAAHLVLREDRDLHRVAVAEIRRLEAQGNYVKVRLGGRELLVTDTLARMEGRLAPHGFVRVHRSHVVNLAFVTRVSPEAVDVDGYAVPLGNGYRQDFLRRLG